MQREINEVYLGAVFKIGPHIAKARSNSMQERMSSDSRPSIPCLPCTEITSVTQTKVSPCGVQTSAVLSSPPWRRMEFSSLWSEFTPLALLVANTMAERQCDF